MENIERLGEKPLPVPICSPKYPRGLARDRTLISAVWVRRITTEAMARSSSPQKFVGHYN